jgi:hypothetical protein
MLTDSTFKTKEDFMAPVNFYTRANDLLKSIVVETLAGGYIFAPKAEREYLEGKGWVESNPEIVNDAGDRATRATQTGIDTFPKEEKVMSEFIVENIAVEKTRRSSGKKSIYPFDALEVGQSFFVPVSAEKPEPWKSMASTVGTAIRRYAEDVVDAMGAPVMRTVKRGPNEGKMIQETKNTRVFVLKKDTKDGIDGARIGRIA